jgi:hypothetical protein
MSKTKLYFKNGNPYYKSGGKFYPLPKAQVGIGSLAGADLSNQDAMTAATTMAQSTQEPSKLEMFGKKYGPNIMAALPGVLSMVPQKSDMPEDPFVASRMPVKDTRMESGINTALDTAAPFLPGGQAINALRKGIGAVGDTIGGAIGGDAGTVISTTLNPIRRLSDTANILLKGDGSFGDRAKRAAENFLTFGVSEERREDEIEKQLQKRSDEIKAMNAGTNKGNFANYSVYAKKGKNILNEPYKNVKQPNVEIEHGEIYLGNPGSVTKYGKAGTSLDSKYAAKFEGDWHGEDTDKDGMEGIPLNAPEGYIASNFLGLDGKPVKGQKDSKKTGKTVADEMTPLIEFLHKAEQNPKDLYKNNPAVIKQVLNQLEKMKNTAEQNKFREELVKMLRDKQGFNLEDVFEFIKQNAPMEDMTPEQQESLNQLMAGNQQQMPQEGGQELSPELIQQMMAEQGQQPQQAKYGKSMNNYYKRYQQGGKPSPEQIMEMMAQQQGQQGAPQQNPTLAKSSNRMEDLLNKAKAMTNQQQLTPSVDQMDDQVKEMFNALPDEVKEQIVELPSDQQEIAIINAYQQIMAEEQMAAQGEQQMMEGEVEMEESGMSPEDVASMAEQQALEMMYGGQLAKAQKGRNQEYMDAYSDAARALGLTDEELAQQIKEQQFAFKPQGKLKSDSVIANKLAIDQFIKEIPDYFQGNDNSQLQTIIQNEVERQERINQMHDDINKAKRINDLYDNIDKAKRFSDIMDTRLFKKQTGGQNQMAKPVSNIQPVVDPYAQYVTKQKEEYKKQYNEDFNPLSFNSTPGTDSTIFKQGNKQFNLLTRDGFEKQQAMKTPTVATKADGGYPDSTINRSGFTNEYYGDQYKAKSYNYQDGQSPKAANAHMPRGMMSDRFNPLMGNNVDPYSAFGEQGDSRGSNGAETYDNRRKFESELAKSKQGGMIGKTIQYKKGGQVKSGKIIGISKTGKYIVK